MDWIHCNSCYKQPRQSAPGRKFFLTSCGHVYCGVCVNSKPTQEKCLVCGNTYTVIHLNEEMKPEVQEYFKDIYTSMKKITEVMVFQNGHRQRLAMHSKLVDDKYAAAKEEVKRLYEVVKARDKRIQEQENALKFYKRKIDELQSALARPAATPPNNGRPVINPNSGRPVMVHKHTPSPVMSNSMKILSQKILQTTQGMQKSCDHLWLTPNRLTLQYKPMPKTPVTTRPSPDSSMTPSQSSESNIGVNYGAYRKNNSYSSQPTTPGDEFVSPAVSVHSSNTPNCPQYYRQSGGSNGQHHNQYYDSSVPLGSSFNLRLLKLSTQRARGEPQKK